MEEADRPRASVFSMMALHRIVVRIASKATTLAAIVAAATIVAGVLLIFADERKLDAGPQLRTELAALDTKLTEVEARIEQLQVDIPPEQERVLRSEKVIAQLEQLKSTWDWLVGNREQQRANAKRIEDMQAFHAKAAARVAELQQELRRMRWERDGHVMERDAVAKRLREEEARQATWNHRWWQVWLRVRGWIAIALGGYLLVFAAVPAWWRQRRLRGEAGV